MSRTMSGSESGASTPSVAAARRRRSVAAALVACSVALCGCKMAPIIGGPLEEPKLADGVYDGSYRNGPNRAEVRVTVRDGRIAQVELIRHAASWIGHKADAVIPGRIVEQQSTDVDAVSGATNSSRVIMNAAHRALQGAGP